MKKILSILFALMLCLGASAQFAQAPAFPGAEGYGRYVTGGRGGNIIHVTNLNDSGPGSLRSALEQSIGRRIVVFDVCGTIALQSRLSIKNANVTVLGQTAPGDGICIANYPLYINANNVILRYLRCRMGDTYNVEDDAMSSYTHAKANSTDSHKNIIIDHCSMSWSTDECGSFYGNQYFTLQWCYLTESLRISVHDKGKHGYGGIWGGKTVSYHHNLLAHHDSRNARLDHDYVNEFKGVLDYVNNCVYNWGGNNCYGGESVKGTGYRMVNFIGNYYKPGPATTSRMTQLVNATSYCTYCCHTDGKNVEPAHFYMHDNYIVGAAETNADNWKGVIPDNNNPIDVMTLKSDVPFTVDDANFQYNTISIHSAATAWDKVLAYGGASYHRDVIDTRISNEAANGSYTYTGSQGSTGGLIDSQQDVGGWCTLNTYDKLEDTDNDGMPDVWEEANGLNPNSKDDAKEYTLDPKGYYTNIEVYANSLVEDQIREQRAGAEQTFEEYYPECKRIKIVTEEEVLASGSVKWALQSKDGLQELQDAQPVISGINDYIDVAEAFQGSNFSLSGTFTDADGVKGITFTSADACDGSDNSSVRFSVIPQSDYSFRPSSVEFYAVKNGTNTETILNADITNNEGYMAVASNVSLPRATSSSDGPKSAYHCNEVIANPVSSDSKSTLKLRVNGLPEGKQFGVSNVILNGEIVKKTKKVVIDDPTAITEVLSRPMAPTSVYNLAGQRVSSSTKGILVRHGKKYINR